MNLSLSAQRVPFVVQFRTDQNEQVSDDTPTTATANAVTSEVIEWPAGIVGFSLNYVQNDC